MVYKVFDKKLSGGGVNIKTKKISNLRMNLKKIKKRRPYSTSKGNILANMQLISKFGKGIRFLLVLLIVLVNMHAFVLKKIKRLKLLLMLFKKY